jgi:hypothetical protein
MRKAKGLSAWLVTWEWSGNHAARHDKVVEILDPRIWPERVREIVELLYYREASLSEKATWRLRERRHPYPAEFTRLHGAKWEGEIICGHNPWLHARLVDNLIIQTDDYGKETASWTDRHSRREMAERIRRFQNGLRGGRTG